MMLSDLDITFPTADAPALSQWLRDHKIRFHQKRRRDDDAMSAIRLRLSRVDNTRAHLKRIEAKLTTLAPTIKTIVKRWPGAELCVLITATNLNTGHYTRRLCLSVSLLALLARLTVEFDVEVCPASDD